MPTRQESIVALLRGMNIQYPLIREDLHLHVRQPSVVTRLLLRLLELGRFRLMLTLLIVIPTDTAFLQTHTTC